MNEIMQVIKNRRSIRSFSADQIRREELDVIVEAGMYAPSAAGKQAWHFTVVQNQQIIDEISSEAKRIYRSSDIEFLRTWYAPITNRWDKVEAFLKLRFLGKLP